LLREPVAIVDILSPSNAADTWANVVLYATIPSVHEILVLHTAEVRGEILRRGGGGQWRTDPEQVPPSGEVRLDSIAFAAPLTAFYRTA